MASTAPVATAPANSSRCMLLKIAPELRNRIYEAVFESDPVATIDSNYHLPGILRTCRQTHEEAIQLYYASTTFTYTFHPGVLALPQDNHMQPWLKALPEKYRSLIPAVRYSSRALHDLFARLLGILEEGQTVTEEIIKDLRLRHISLDFAGKALEVFQGLLRSEQVEVPWVEVGEKWRSWKVLGEVEEEARETARRRRY